MIADEAADGGGVPHDWHSGRPFAMMRAESNAVRSYV
jgi:hypothetical protein